jgi:hypothetical protein
MDSRFASALLLPLLLPLWVLSLTLTGTLTSGDTTIPGEKGESSASGDDGNLYSTTGEDEASISDEYFSISATIF